MRTFLPSRLLAATATAAACLLAACATAGFSPAAALAATGTTLHPDSAPSPTPVGTLQITTSGGSTLSNTVNSIAVDWAPQGKTTIELTRPADSSALDEELTKAALLQQSEASGTLTAYSFAAQRTQATFGLRGITVRFEQESTKAGLEDVFVLSFSKIQETVNLPSAAVADAAGTLGVGSPATAAIQLAQVSAAIAPGATSSSFSLIAPIDRTLTGTLIDDAATGTLQPSLNLNVWDAPGSAKPFETYNMADASVSLEQATSNERPGLRNYIELVPRQIQASVNPSASPASSSPPVGQLSLAGGTTVAVKSYDVTGGGAQPVHIDVQADSTVAAASDFFASGGTQSTVDLLPYSSGTTSPFESLSLSNANESYELTASRAGLTDFFGLTGAFAGLTFAGQS